ncbi:MAG: hypothetical protein M1491_00295 [Deltaproteobacteria bacterium]|nr:hypothetical protein [Deltaproteobacteria bacterium]MCL5277810.1 hypothetical protein [Deltaproteobacteria bacterium]
MKIRYLIVFILLIFAGVILSTSPSYAVQYVSEGAWAVALVRGLGWEGEGIPQQPSLMDYFDLLSGRNFINVDLKDYATRLGTLPDTLTYNVNVEHSGRYHLIVYVDGNPMTFTLDDEPTASSSFSNGGNYEDMGTFILKRGVHRLSITVPNGGSVLALYLSSLAQDAIQPKGGWIANKVLDYGAEARTMAAAMDDDDKLPVRYQIPSTARAGQNGREFIFQSQSDPVINFSMTFQGPSKGYVMVDNSIVIPYEFHGGGMNPFTMRTISLGPGAHTAYVKAVSGQLPSAFVINQHDDSSEACVALMRMLGFSMGFAYQPVPYSIASTTLGELIAQSGKKKPAGKVSIEETVVQKTELPSQRVLRTYREPISPMRPFEE